MGCKAIFPAGGSLSSGILLTIIIRVERSGLQEGDSAGHRPGGTAKGGKQLSFNGTYATGDRVVPAGSMWAKIPIPLIQAGDGPLGYIGYPIAPGCAELWGNKSAAMCSGMGDGTSNHGL